MLQPKDRIMNRAELAFFFGVARTTIELRARGTLCVLRALPPMVRRFRHTRAPGSFAYHRLRLAADALLAREGMPCKSDPPSPNWFRWIGSATCKASL